MKSALSVELAKLVPNFNRASFTNGLKIFKDRLTFWRSKVEGNNDLRDREYPNFSNSLLM
jgi:hypothetical protein